MAKSREEINAARRARRAAAKAQVEPVTVEPVTVETVETVEPVTVEQSSIVATGPVEVEGKFIEPDPVYRIQAAEDRVIRLIDAQAGVDAGEHESIIGMIEDCRTGIASPAEFCKAYSELAQGRMAPDSVKSRKSNLKGVLSFAMESQDFVLRITAPSAGVIGLQAMYKLRQAMLKGPEDDEEKSKRVRKGSDADADADVDADVDADDAPKMSPNDLMLHRISYAIDAAAKANFPEIAEKLRAVFYLARAAIVEQPETETVEEPEEVEA